MWTPCIRYEHLISGVWSICDHRSGVRVVPSLPRLGACPRAQHPHGGLHRGDEQRRNGHHLSTYPSRTREFKLICTFTNSIA